MSELTPQATPQANPQAIMAAHGKSFYFASLFFPQSQFADIALLYSVCRYIDDTADEQSAEAARPALTRIRQQIEDANVQGPLRPALDRLFALGVEKKHLLELIDGAEFDARGETVTDRHMLIQYSYWVAGVVGLMMCPLLGTRDPEAGPYAADLGIGMQITNICRDVLGDALNGRTYLPGLDLKQLLAGETPENVRRIVKEHLDLADSYYESGYRGLGFLPFRARLCIVLAGEVYRHIGEKIREKNYNVLRGRVYLTYFEKVRVALKCVVFLLQPRFWRPRRQLELV